MVSPTNRSLLACGAVTVALGGVISGTMSPLVAIICAVSLPVTIIWSPSWPDRVANAVGLAHLLLVADLLTGVNDHDLRYSLADTLLAVSGLHAAKLTSRRDHAVAVGIQLTILACGLSQVDTTTHGTIGTLAWVITWVTLTVPQLRELRGLFPGPQGRRRPGGRNAAALVGVFAVAALLWAIIPIPALRSPQSVSQSNVSSAATGGRPAAATPGIDRVGNTTMNLNARGRGTNTPVLLVRGAEGLLRGEIFDRYDGTTFSRTPTGTQALIGDQQVVLPASAGDTSLHTAEEISLLQAQSSVLSIGQPVQVGLSQPATSDGLGDVLVSQSIPAGSDYATVGGRPGNDAQAAAQPADEALWLQLPAELPQRVRDLARTWSAGATTPTEAVAAIEAKMGATLRYDLDSPVAPAGADAVDDVLFRSHSGFCEQFAASETVLLRSLGIPARVVGGFAQGNRTEGDATVVTDSDAHAWVEFWSPHVGWITTDPTASVPLADTKAPTLRQKLRHDLADIPWYAWVLIGLGLVSLVAAVVLVRRVLRRRRAALIEARAALEAPVTGPVRAAFAELVAAGTLADLPLRATETPGDYLMRVPGGWSRHEEILPALERELWGPAPPPDASTERAVAALQELSRDLALAAVPG